MIEINQLCKKFDQLTAVDQLSFTVKEGEVLGFLGPNGAGKSTTMKLITGFIKPTAGSISVCGFDIAEQPLQVKSLIGYLPEGAPCYGDMTTLKFLRFIGEIRGFRGEELQRRVQNVIEQVNLASVTGQTIKTLSKGFKRRVGLAQAILHDPKVLILDEPTDGLDPNQKHQVRKLIKSLSKEKIVIISTHILEEVTAVCSRAIIIAAGKIVADGTPAELQARSRYHQAVRVKLSEHSPSEHSSSEHSPSEHSPSERRDIMAQFSGLEGIEGIASIEENADRSITILPGKGKEIFSSIVALAQKNKWPVTELNVSQGRLDDVFREVTAGVQ